MSDFGAGLTPEAQALLKANIMRAISAQAPRAMPAGVRLLIAEQLDGILAERVPADWQGRPELPDPAPELLDTYDVARTWALRHCEHQRANRVVDPERALVECYDCRRHWSPLS